MRKSKREKKRNRQKKREKKRNRQKKRGKRGGAVAQSVERATPGEEVPGPIPAVATRSLLVGSVSV